MRAYKRQELKDVFIEDIIQNVLFHVTELNSPLKSLRFSASNDCNKTFVCLSNISKEHNFLSANIFGMRLLRQILKVPLLNVLEYTSQTITNNKCFGKCID